MTVYLVRHAQAGSHRRWGGADDRLRPLLPEGRHQAAELASLADRVPDGQGSGRAGPAGDASVIATVRSSPYRRCIETVAPLAAACGLTVGADEALAEGPGDGALALVRSLWGTAAVLCSHGDVIPSVLHALVVQDDLDLGPGPRCEKASVWCLEAGATEGRFARATYLPPPRWK